MHGIWNYFTVDDGQVDLANDSYLLVGTLESYRKVQAYYGLEQVIPIYVEVEDGLRPVSYTQMCIRDRRCMVRTAVTTVSTEARQGF